ncbi:MAG: hypothetical protein FWD40_08915 [Treponema sp.]|nr:hypothetical protein [Treponema sp.]
MKKITIYTLIAAIILVLSGCQSLPSTDLPFITIVNNTGYDCYSLYLSPVTKDSWDENVLHGSILQSGQSVRVRLSYPLYEENHYDFLLIDEDDDRYGKLNIHIDGEIRIVFTMNDFIRFE